MTADTSLLITIDDVLADLGAGRDRPLTIPAPLAPTRPALGDRAFLATLLRARAALRLGRPAGALLERLWFTPWTVGRTTRRPAGAGGLSVPWPDGDLAGWQVGEGSRTVLLVHGWGGRSTDLAHVASHLVDAGWRVVAVDMPAHGASPGGRTDLFEMADAVRAAADHLGGVEAIVAHSLGSVAALLAVAGGLDVPRVAVIAPPASLEGAVGRFVQRAGIGRRGERSLRRRIERTFGADVWDRLRVEATADDVTADVLVVHDVDDREVPVGDGLRVARAFGRDPVLTIGLGHGRILLDPDVGATVVAHVEGNPGPAFPRSALRAEAPVLAS